MAKVTYQPLSESQNSTQGQCHPVVKCHYVVIHAKEFEREKLQQRKERLKYPEP